MAHSVNRSIRDRLRSKRTLKRDPAIIEAYDRQARAYGWEIGAGHPMAEKIESSLNNPFLDPNWREHHGLS